VNFKTVLFDVKNTEPMWFHCRQSGHCVSGMVFAVNPRNDEQFNEFKKAATSGGAPPIAAPAESDGETCSSDSETQGQQAEGVSTPARTASPTRAAAGTTTSRAAAPTLAASNEGANPTSDASPSGPNVSRIAVNAIVLAILGVIAFAP
jgi:hypothetical protein